MAMRHMICFPIQVLVIDRNGYYGGEAASLNVDVSWRFVRHAKHLHVHTAGIMPATQELYRKFIDPKAEEASAEFKASLGDNRCALPCSTPLKHCHSRRHRWLLAQRLLRRPGAQVCHG